MEPAKRILGFSGLQWPLFERLGTQNKQRNPNVEQNLPRPAHLRLVEIGGETLPKHVHAKKVAVVTGGNRGMGLETCRQLAGQGFTVVLTSRNEKAGKAATRALRQEGLDVVYQRLDVTDERSANNLGGFLRHTYGRIDVLVNNAGAVFEPLEIGAPDAPGLLDTDEETLRRTLEVNTLGPLLVARALTPLMKERESGLIINVSSELARDPDVEGAPAYRFSKASLEVATRMLAAELEDSGVKVNAVDPGWVQTDMGGDAAPLTPEQGVATTVWLATMDADEMPTGGLYRERSRNDL